MSQSPRLPIETIPPGTTLVVGSEDRDLAQTFGSVLLSMGCNPDDGVMFVSADTPTDDLLARCDHLGLDLDVIDLQVIADAGSQPSDPGPDVGVETMSSTDLTGLGITFSVVYESLMTSGCKRILSGVHTLSTILEENDLRTVVRFLNTVSRRIESGGGLMVFVIDSGAHGDETLTTLSQVCDGYAEVRGSATNGAEIRMHGLPNQPDGWISLPQSLFEPIADRDT